MKYEDWKAIYVDTSKTVEQWQSEHKDFKAEINELRKNYKSQKTKGLSAAELEKTIKAAGKLTVEEVKKINLYNTPPNEKIDIDLLLQTRNNYASRLNRLFGNIPNTEYSQLYSVYLDIDVEYKRFENLANAQKFTEFEKRSEQIKGILSQVREMGATPQQLQMQFGKSKSKIRPMVEKAVNCYPREWVEMSANRGALKLKKVERGHYNDFKGELTISGEGGKAFETAIHEFGHRMEYTFGDIVLAEKEFYARRTAGEKLEKLKKLTGQDYNATEVTRKDKFLDVYMGKDYGGRAYELVSMGFQYAFTNPERLMLDGDMAEWIFGLLAIV